MAAINPPAIKSELGANDIPPSNLKQEDPDHVKSELSDADDDDELYEDAGDLDMMGGDKAVWLVRLPSFVAERWNEIDDDEEIVLGIVKVNKRDQNQLKLVLERSEANADIPLEYDLNITNMECTNTYVFTEKDMPGYANKINNGGVKEGEPPIPARLLYGDRQKSDHSNGKKWGQSQRFQPYVRRAIPKRTSLVGTVRHECAMLPVVNEEYKSFQKKRNDMAAEPKHTTRFLEHTAAAGNLLAPGTTGATGKSFSTFVRPTQQVRKPTDNKAARMPKSELLTALFQCFNEHEYWSMRGFREKLVQPEQYLKQTLDEIALMNKAGPFTGKWSLKSEYKGMDSNNVREFVGSDEGASGGAEGSGGAGGDVIELDDEEDMDFENVL